MTACTEEFVRVPKRHYCHSLCIECALAYGHLCLAVPFDQRDWVKAFQESPKKGNIRDYTVRSVTDCERYSSQQEPVPMAPRPNHWERPWPDPSLL